MILLIDNYDSFVHNLSRYFVEMGCETLVRRNDAVSLTDINQLRPQAIVLSPGPGTPVQAGMSLDIVRAFAGQIPLLGVCLGHQAIAAAFGGKIIPAREPVHGRTSPVRHDEDSLFAGFPNPFRATRYHSLVVDEHSLPEELRVTARTADGTVMAIQHTTAKIYGVQFHPESILTESGHALLHTFLHLVGISAARKSLCELPPNPQQTTADIRPAETGQVIHW